MSHLWPITSCPLTLDRQREGEGRPPAQLALDPDPAPVQLDELLRQGQPEAGALLLPRLVAPHLAKLLEDSRLVFGGNPDTGIGDRGLDQAVLPASLQADPAPLRGELDRIRQEVEEDLFDLAFVAHDLPEARVDVELQGDAVPARPLLDQGDGVLQGGR